MFLTRFHSKMRECLNAYIDRAKDLWQMFSHLYSLFLDFIFISFWLCWIFIAACGLSLVAMSGNYFPVVLSRLLIEVASLIVEHGF